MNWFRRVLQVISYIIAVVGILMVASQRCDLQSMKEKGILRSFVVLGRVDGLSRE